MNKKKWVIRFFFFFTGFIFSLSSNNLLYESSGDAYD